MSIEVDLKNLRGIKLRTWPGYLRSRNFGCTYGRIFMKFGLKLVDRCILPLLKGHFWPEGRTCWTMLSKSCHFCGISQNFLSSYIFAGSWFNPHRYTQCQSYIITILPHIIFKALLRLFCVFSLLFFSQSGVISCRAQ